MARTRTRRTPAQLKRKVGEVHTSPEWEGCSLAEVAAIKAYLRCWDGPAAILATTTDKITRACAYGRWHSMLRRVPFRAALEEQVERAGISKAKLASRHVEIIEADLADLEEDLGGDVLQRARKRGFDTRAVRKLKVRRRTQVTEEGTTATTDTEVELYDRQKSLEALGRLYQHDSQRHEHELRLSADSLSDEELLRRAHAAGLPVPAAAEAKE